MLGQKCRVVTSLFLKFLKKFPTDFVLTWYIGVELIGEQVQENSASISALVFELFKKFARGGKIYPPPVGRGLKVDLM